MADGQITVSGSLLNDKGQITANGETNLNVKNDLRNQGTVTVGSLQSTGNQLDNSNGKIEATRLQSNTHLFANHSGEINIRERAHIQSQILDNIQGKLIAGDMINIDTGTGNNQDGKIESTTAININSQESWHNHAGTIAANQAIILNSNGLNNQYGSIVSNKDYVLLNAGHNALDNQHGVIQAAKNITSQSIGVQNQYGTIHGQNTVINAGSKNIANLDGKLLSQENLLITGGALDNTRGHIVANRDMVLDTQNQKLNNTTGKMASGQNLLLQSGTLVNQNGSVIVAQKADINTAGQDIDNSNTQKNGGIHAEYLHIQSGNLNNQAGAISSRKTNIYAQNTINDKGQISATEQLDLSMQDIQNQAGSIQSNKILNLNAGKLDNHAGTIRAETADLKTKDLINTANKNLKDAGIQAATLSINTGTLDNSEGQIISNHHLPLTVRQALINTQGLIASGGGLDIGSDASMLPTINNDSGQLHAAGNMSLSGKTLNNNGAILSNGSVTAKIQHQLQNSGLISAQTAVQIQSPNVLNNGRINTAGKLVAKADNWINNQGRVEADAIVLDSTQLDNRNGTLQQNGQGNLTIHIGNGLNNRQGILGAAQTGSALTTNNGSISNNTNGASTAPATTAPNVKTYPAEAATPSSITYASAAPINGHIKVGKELDNQQGRITANGLTDLYGKGDVDNAEGTLTLGQLKWLDANLFDNHSGKIQTQESQVSAQDVNNTQGVWMAQQQLAIQTVNTLTNTGGKLIGGNDITLAAIDLNNQNGQIATTKSLQANIKGNLDNQQGNISANQSLTLTALNLNNTAGELGSANSSVSIYTADKIQNQHGIVSAAQQLKIKGQSLLNQSGTLSGRDVNVDITKQALDNTHGKILSATNLVLNTVGLDNQSGNIHANDLLAINTHKQRLNNRYGNISTTGTLDINGGELNNEKGLIQGNNALTINTHKQTLNNQSTKDKGLLTQGKLDIQTGVLHNQDGSILSGQSARIAGATLNNQSGQLQAAETLILQISGDVLNQSGTILAGKTLSVHAANIKNRQTDVTGHGLQGEQVQISANNIDNQQGRIAANKNTVLMLTGELNNQQGKITAVDTLAITGTATGESAAAVNNQAGELTAGMQLNLYTDKLINTAGNIKSLGHLESLVGSDYTEQGTIAAEGNTNIQITGTLNNEGHLQAGQKLSISAQNLNNASQGKINATDTQIKITQQLNNRGLIDGNSTYLQAQTIHNLGEKAKIYGDLLAISANTVINDTENGKAGTIAARQRLDMGVTTLTNREQALIFSGGDLAIGGSLDHQNHATGKADNINNNSATIESLGNMYLATRELHNTNEHFKTELVEKQRERHVEYEANGRNERLTDGTQAELGWGVFNDEIDKLRTPDGHVHEDWHRYDYWRTTKQTEVTETAPAKIIAGGGLKIDAHELWNTDSQIIAGGKLTVNIEKDKLHNQEILGTKIVQDLGCAMEKPDGSGCYTIREARAAGLNVDKGRWSSGSTPGLHWHWRDRQKGRDNTGHKRDNYAPAPEISNSLSLGSFAYEEYTAVNSETQVDKRQGLRITADVVADIATVAPEKAVAAKINTGKTTQLEVNTTDTEKTTATTQAEQYQANTQGTTSTQQAQQNDAVNGSDVVVRTGTPNTRLPGSSLFALNAESGTYLIESDPQFTQYRQWLGSNYMLNALKLDPNNMHKRLGDGYYEQRLLNEQIAQLTGRRYLDGYSNDEAQFKALMDSGISAARTMHLTPGVALTAEQVARLTSDIVWLVEQNVTLPDGSVRQALVPQVYVRVQAGDIHGNGALLSGSITELNVAGTLNNSGTVAGREALRIGADTVDNINGRISSNKLIVDAKQDINNTGGMIDAANSLLLQAGRDINHTSTTHSSENSQGSVTNLNRIAGVYITGPENGALVLAAGRDVRLTAAAIGNMSADGQTTIQANRDLKLDTVSTARHQENHLDANNHIIRANSADVGSNIQTRGQLTMLAGNNIEAASANVGSQNTLKVAAGNDILIGAGQQSLLIDDASKHTGRTGGGRKQVNISNIRITENTAQGSSFNANDVQMAAGNNLHITGSNVLAQQSNRISAGNNITIEAAGNQHSQHRYDEEKRSGLTGSLKDGVASVGYSKSSHSLQQDSSGQSLTLSQVGSINGDTTIVSANRLTATAARLGAGQDLTLQGKEVNLDAGYISGGSQTEQQSKQSGLSIGITYDPFTAAKTAYDKSMAGNQNSGSVIGKTFSHGIAVGKAGMAATTPIVVAGGRSRSSSEQNSSHSQAVVSELAAGGNLNIIATEGKIRSQGAQISAEGDALLSARDNITLEFARDSQSQSAQSRRSGFAIDNRDHIMPVGTFKDSGSGQGALDKTTGSLLSVGGAAVLQSSQGDINVLGSTIVSQNDLTLNAKRNINIFATQDSRHISETQVSSGIGSVQISDTEYFSGWMKNTKNSHSNQVEQVKSQIGSLSGDVRIQAGGNYTQQVADINAGQNISIDAQRIDILADHNRGNSHQSERDIKIGTFAKVSSPLIDLVNATEGVVKSKADDRTRALQGMAAGAQGYQLYGAAGKVADAAAHNAQVAAAALQNGVAVDPKDLQQGAVLAKAEIGVGFKTSKSQQDSRYAQSQSNALNAGGNISLTSREGDIRAQHSQIKAGDTIALNSAKDIILESGQSQQQADGKNSNAGLSVGMGVSVGAQTGVYVYGEAGWGSGKNQLDANTHSNTTLQSNKLVLNSKGDTTLKGASASANRIDADIGGKLHIESLQDQVDQSSSQTGAGVRVQVSFGTAWEASGNFSSDKTSGSLSAVNQQSGLFAGDGGYHINADSVHLKGGAIASTAAKEHNQLTTKQLSFEDIRNHSNYSASSVALAGSYGSNSPGQNTDNAAFQDTKLGKAFANSAGDGGFNYSPSLPQQTSGNDSSTTRATLSAGNLTIGGKATTVEALGIHSDPASAHRQLAELPDLQAVLAQQKTVAQATATIAGAARTFSSDRVKAAERAKAEAQTQLQAAEKSNDLSQIETAKQQYQQAEQAAKDWGIGGGNSRALSAVTTAITGALGGQNGLQVASNTLAPYAAATIGNTFGHNGSDPNQAAQLLSHAILGATLAYVNGGNASSGAVAAVGSEAAAIYLTQTLYKDQATDENGVFDPNRLPEKDKEHIRNLTAAIGAVAGGIAGDSGINAQIAGVVGQNAVENNYYLTPNALKKSPEQVRKDYAVLKDSVKNECSPGGRVTECRQGVERIITFAKDARFTQNYGDLQQESMRYLSDNPQLVADYLIAQSNKLNREDNSPLNRYVIPGAEVVGGVTGMVVSVKGGAAACAGSFGFGCAAAAVGVYTSADHVITGGSNFGKKASEQNPTITVQGLKQLGLSEQAANYVQFAIDTVSVGKAGISVPAKVVKPNYASGSAKNMGKTFSQATSGDVININPADLRWTQRTAGGNGRADVLRESIKSQGYAGDPIDIVKTVDGAVTLDHTRAAIALEQGIKNIPARVHLPSDPLPPEMIKNKRFGNSKTWGEAASYRAGKQNPALPSTGTKIPPKLPSSKQ
ncbi:hemagglutinin repeat-containing protein [Paralysiella testudinis]|uniref:hemagglutinin repeat-containing protein n=1 Tax=Paralysiella testudinis TaxID=2809020 RepID=UPI001E61CCAB|nr:hemagglutinin repeat-containing protein [Paralysiella testudinis]